MKKDDLKQGTAYALRPKGSGRGDPFVKVTYVGSTHGRQGRIRYEAGELEGLEEWIPTRQIACKWGERKALLHDEERSARLAKSDEDVWDKVTEDAISAVMTASGEYGGFVGHWDTDEASAMRYWARTKLEGSLFDDDPVNYRDWAGTWHLSVRTALKAARAFAAAEPEMVDIYLRGWEQRLRADGFEFGKSDAHDLLRLWAPSHALARSWSQEPRGSAAEREVERLHGLVSTAIRCLREAGKDEKANRIERSLHGR